MRLRYFLLTYFIILFLLGNGVSGEVATDSLEWKDCLQQPKEWYASNEAVRIADQVLLYQKNDGGWPKNIDMAKPLSKEESDILLRNKENIEESTIDNSSTFRQIRYLCRVYNATKEKPYSEGVMKGIHFLLQIQYVNGGWPQFPYKKGYYQHITFNDNAMTGVLDLLYDIVKEPEFLFVDKNIQASCNEAIFKGIDCILKCQVIEDGKKTVWCAQHDEKSLAPAEARKYEKISLSGAESASIVKFLMKMENPDSKIIEAIQGAVAWFDQVKINGIRQEKKADASLPGGYDKIIVQDASAPALWARFYEIGSNKPIFCGRNGIIKYTLAEIEHERRVGYSWYTEQPAELLNKDYPAWKAKWEKRN